MPDVTLDAACFDEPAAARTVNTNRVRFVDDKRCARRSAERRVLGQRREVAVHAEERFHDDKTVTLITQNETLTLPRNEIQSLQQSELSMMPEGLLAPLTDQEARDLLYYLSRPGQVPLPGESKVN